MEVIGSLLDVFNGLIADLVAPNERSQVCQHGSFLASNPCESIILGSVTIGLMREGLWPIPSLEDVDMSVEEVYQKLSNIIIYDFGQVSTEDVDHSKCNPAAFLTDKIKGIFETISSPITDWQRQQLETRTKILYV